MKLNIFTVVLLVTIVTAHAQPRRPMVVDDLFNIETLTDVRLSPDGSALAVVIQRAWSNPETYRPYSMFGNDHADIWLVPTAGGAPRNLTHGARDGAGYWNPVWSPDSQRLALLSTAGKDNVRPYIWDKRSDRLTRAAERGVDMWMRTNATGDANPLQWIDETHLLVTVLPEGEQPFYYRVRRQTRQIASAAWEKLAAGREPTSSILEGGVAPEPRRPDQLLRIDASTMRTDVLVEGPIEYVLVSPDRERAAVVVQARRPAPPPGELLASRFAAPSRLGFVTLRGLPTTQWIETAFNPVVEFGGFRHRWSPDGSTLAVLGTFDAQVKSPRVAFLVTSSDGSVRRTAEGLDVSSFAWSADGQLVVQARTSGQNARLDWWRVSADGPPRNLTAGAPVAPTALMRTATAHELIGLVDGSLWRFNGATGDRRAIATGGIQVGRVLWPSAEERAQGTITSLVVSAGDGANNALRVDVGAGTFSSFPTPPKATTVAAYDRVRNVMAFTAPNDPDGTFLWTGSGGSTNFIRRLALNEQLSRLAAGDLRLIEYRSLDGQNLKAILMLPAGYQQGARYPLVTFIYPGFVVREISNNGFWYTKNQAHMDNLHVLASHGYAVLIASMPASVNANSRDLADMTNGVLPAVDRAVELGIADGNRVAVMGQSGGGFVTYGLITQTNRFKAAIAISGPSNHVTSYGVFSGESRYVSDVDEILSGSSSGRFGSPPWMDPDPYIRNSPTMFMHRVETPLLILHGDLDYVPIQHAEEVFTSLARMGKRVRFVRYWGESHGAGDSPANVRDRWAQIFRWLDTYLRDR